MPDSTFDQILVYKTLKGDDDAFEELVRRYKTCVMKIVYHSANSQLDIDEMTQDVFIKAYFSLKSYKHKAPFQHWLSRIATRVAIDNIRKRTNKKIRYFSEISENTEQWIEKYFCCQGNENKIDPVIQNDLRNVINSALEKLSAKNRWIMTAYQIEGYTVNEISEMTGWGRSATKVRLMRARKKLKHAITQLLQEWEIPYE